MKLVRSDVETAIQANVV